MKKFFTTILSFIYLVTTTGATLHTHYCMGEVYSVDLISEDGCSKCGMEANKGCCNDEIKVIKVQDNHQGSASEVSLAPQVAIIQHQFDLYQPAYSNSITASLPNNNSPPATSGPALCILNCIFRL